MAFDKSYCYYKHLSEFTMKYECEFDSRKPEQLEVRKITEVSMNCAGCAEHNDGIKKLQKLIENPLVEAQTVTYPGFKILRLGIPKTIYLPDEKSQQFMRKDLSEKPVMAYWDDHSIAFIVSDECEWDYKLFGQFLSEARHITYVPRTGILVKMQE